MVHLHFVCLGLFSHRHNRQTPYWLGSFDLSPSITRFMLTWGESCLVCCSFFGGGRNGVAVWVLCKPSRRLGGAVASVAACDSLPVLGSRSVRLPGLASISFNSSPQCFNSPASDLDGT